MLSLVLCHRCELQVASMLIELGIEVPCVDALSVRVVDRNFIKASLKGNRQSILGNREVYQPKQALGLTAKALKQVRTERNVTSERSIDHIALLQGLPAHHMGYAL